MRGELQRGQESEEVIYQFVEGSGQTVSPDAFRMDAQRNDVCVIFSAIPAAGRRFLHLLWSAGMPKSRGGGQAVSAETRRISSWSHGAGVGRGCVKTRAIA